MDLSAFRINKLTGRKLISIILNLSLILLILYPLLAPKKADAAVTEAFVRFNRHSTGAAISGTACLKSTLTTQTNVVIVFPLGWTISSTASNWTVTTTNLPVDPQGGSVAAWPGIGTATSVNGLSVVFPGSAFSSSTTLYCFNFSGASSTIGSAGNDKTGQLKTQGGAPYTDSVDWATSVVSSNADQITVTASVSATMSFSLSGNSVSLGTLSTSSVTYDATGITQSVLTNARNGYISWIKGTSTTGGTGGSLHSTTANADIPSPGSFPTVTDLASNTGVVVDATPGGSNPPTINAGYDGNGTTSGGHFDGGVFHETASYSTGPTASSTVIYHLAAKIASTQAAASDYTDTLTVVAAGSF